MSSYKYNIYEEGKTILEFLSSFHLGKEKIKLYSRPNHILVNGDYKDLNYKLKLNDTLVLIDEQGLDVIPLKKKLNIIYEDEYLLIVNKPTNILIHSDGNLNTNNTLSNVVANYYKNIGLDIPVRYIHRLDKDTTGIVIFAKDPLTEAYLDDLIDKRILHRDYLAFVEGNLSEDIVINKPIGRDRHINNKYRISNTGKEAITEVSVVKKYKKYTLVRLSLKTGRTHQIRVHMASISHPLCGDTLYGGSLKYISRPALHSYYVKFNDIYGRKIEITQKLPFDMENMEVNCDRRSNNNTNR